jgi:hypothetical protein
MFSQAIHIAAHVVHAALREELVDLAVEGQLLGFGPKSLSVAVEFRAQLIGHAKSLDANTALDADNGLAGFVTPSRIGEGIGDEVLFRTLNEPRAFSLRV